MKVSDLTKSVLSCRRFSKKMRAAGYRESEPWWEIVRGFYTNSRITDVQIDPSGKHIWSKVDPPVPSYDSERVDL